MNDKQPMTRDVFIACIGIAIMFVIGGAVLVRWLLMVLP